MIWTTAELAEVCTLITDGTHHSPPNTASGEFKYVTAKNIRPWGLDVADITYVDAETHRGIYARCPVEYGDVLYIKDGVTTGIAVLNTLDEPFSMLSSVALLKPNREVLESRYLKHWLNSPLAYRSMTGEMTGTAIKRLVLKQIRVTQIPVPPLPEQKRIADKLDSVLARVDACRDRLDRIPVLLKRFRQSVLNASTSGELSADWRASEALDGWAPVTIKEICHSISDGDHQAPPQVDQGISFITISAFSSGRLDLNKATRCVPQSYFEQLKPMRRPSLGDVLYSVTGSIGISALVDTDRPFAFQRHVALLKPDLSRVSSAYLRYLLGSDGVRRQAADVATGSAQLTIPLNGLRAFNALLPCLAEQHEIVRRVETLFAFAGRLEARCAAARKQAGQLTPALLAKAFRGELVPQDPADEPAAELLKRLAASRADAPKARRGKPRASTGV